MFLVTGAPRSGTSYTMCTLDRNGLRIGGEGDLPDRSRFDGIVSWKHLTMANQFRDVFVLVREPKLTIQSMQTITLASWHFMIRAIEARFDITFVDGNLLHRASWCYYHWMHWAKSLHATLYRIERFDALLEDLSSITEKSLCAQNVPSDENSRADQYRSFSDDELLTLGGEWYVRCLNLEL